MTTSTHSSTNQPLTVTADLSYFCEEATPDLPYTLTLELTPDELAAVADARELLEKNPKIHSVAVRCTPPEIETWTYDVAYLTVYKSVGCYLFLQGKYDCTEQVEYSVEI